MTKLSISELMEQGKAREKEGDFNEALKYYSTIVKRSPTFASAYNRMMTIHRKQKDYKKEADVIKQAIKTSEQETEAERQTWIAQNRKSAKLSKALAKAIGLLDDKGRSTYEEPQLISWRKRLGNVEKEITSSNIKKK